MHINTASFLPSVVEAALVHRQPASLALHALRSNYAPNEVGAMRTKRRRGEEDWQEVVAAHLYRVLLAWTDVFRMKGRVENECAPE